MKYNKDDVRNYLLITLLDIKHYYIYLFHKKIKINKKQINKEKYNNAKKLINLVKEFENLIYWFNIYANKNIILDISSL